jgi:hypothetical protein
MENVSVTTIERKQMSNKTNFKRIALAVVSALGFGVIAAGPSNATIQAGSTLTIASSTATAIAGAETATAVLTMTYTSTGSDLDSMIVTAVRTAGATPGVTPGFRIPGGVSAPTADSSNALKIVTSSSVAYVDAVQASAVSGTVRFDVIKPTTAGTYTYTFYPSFTGTLASGAVAPAPVSWTLTVTAANTKPAAAQSSIYIGQAEAFATLAGGANGSALPNMGDSTINVTAGTVAGGAQKVAAIGWIQRTSDSSTTLLVPESVTAVITGAGLLSVNASSARAGAVTAGAHETITVWSDARGGVGTITLTTTSMTTWATKTVTFFGTAASATLSARFGTVSKTGNDSATALQVNIKDALQANFTQASYPMYVHSSDTKVVSNGACSGFVTVSATTGLGACSLSGLIVDSGTAKIKVANYAAESTTAQAAAGFVTGEVTIKVVGQAKTVKATFDKAVYNPGDEATVTLTFTDGLGNVVDSHTSLSGALAAGLDYNVGTDMTDTVITFGAGVKTYTYVMPSSGQKVVLSYKGGAGLAGTQTADSVTVTVIDPAEEAANSALDAAQEATDAAIAATDAAILAQEAADEAASAAIAAQETAQAAVDAVTALSAEVTKLVAQLATLQKLLNRVAKRVGVKL